MVKFDVVFLEPAEVFIHNLDSEPRRKVFYNIWKSKKTNDPEFFRKLSGEIWEFRTQYMNRQIRLLAFWDKRDKNKTLVKITHGFVKKTQKTPQKEILKAYNIRHTYYNDK